jgi:ferric-dicitrate binding protein FerR (iron transport regulator)
MIIIHKAAHCRPRLMGLLAVILSAGLVAIAACAPTPQLLRLADGTEVFYLSNTSVKPADDYPRTRQIEVDGEAFIRAAAAAQPLIIRSRLLVLTVSGSSALRVTARSSETGEEADVLYGHVVARKAYPSPQSEPDTLLAGEEVMVNETVDLQEKETADVPALRSWSDALMASVARKNGR